MPFDEHGDPLQPQFLQAVFLEIENNCHIRSENSLGKINLLLNLKFLKRWISDQNRNRSKHAYLI